jgi:delta 1-pyrroline-5-carboxylate dehydrogenase
LQHLVRPHAFEVRDIADLQREIFGPVLHIVRWRGDPAQVIDQINALTIPEIEKHLLHPRDVVPSLAL